MTGIIKSAINFCSEKGSSSKLFILFLISCATTASWMSIEQYAKTYPKIILPVLLILFLSAFILQCFSYGFIKNVYNNEQCVMPKFNTEIIYLFLKALPVAFVWGIYMFIGTLLIYIPTVGPLIFVLLLPFFKYPVISFLKDCDYAGKYNIKNLLLYVKKAFWHTWFLIIKISIFGFLSLIGTMLLVSIIGNVIGIEKLLIKNICTFIGGFYGVIFTLMYIYGMTEIYKEKIELYENIQTN